MVNWLTIGTDGTDEQCFGGLRTSCHRNNAATSFTNGIHKLTDGGFISPSVPMHNLYLPMVNWLTIGTGEHSLFTDGMFIFPSVRMDTDGRNNFTKLTVGMLATVLDNPLVGCLGWCSRTLEQSSTGCCIARKPSTWSSYLAYYSGILPLETSNIYTLSSILISNITRYHFIADHTYAIINNTNNTAFSSNCKYISVLNELCLSLIHQYNWK